MKINKLIKPLKSLPANLVTIFSLLTGVYVIYLSFLGRIELACWLILIAVFLDKLDGLLAKIFKSESSLGLQLDSFADFTVFGVSAFFVMFNYFNLNAHGGLYYFGLVTLCLYLISALIRVARYNVIKETAIYPNLILGAPIPVISGISASLILNFLKYSSFNSPGLFLLWCWLGIFLMPKGLFS